MNSTFQIFKAQAERLFEEYQVKYSDKDPKVAAWMLDTMELALEAGDEELRSCCAGGLMLRYWSVFTKPQPGVEIDYATGENWEAKKEYSGQEYDYILNTTSLVLSICVLLIHHHKVQLVSCLIQTEYIHHLNLEWAVVRQSTSVCLASNSACIRIQSQSVTSK